eukprot:COSAG02_NODE_2846_length_7905_cov_14.993378_3_plen_57_part_00
MYAGIYVPKRRSAQSLTRCNFPLMSREAHGEITGTICMLRPMKCPLPRLWELHVLT